MASIADWKTGRSWRFEPRQAFAGLITEPAEGNLLSIVALLDQMDVQADGYLMAAAPDLLSCCEAMLDLHEAGSWGAPPGEYLAALRSAIAKANGEPS